MSKFDRSKVKEIHKDISDALQQIAKKHGIHSLTTGTLSFNDSKFTVRVTGISSLSSLTTVVRNPTTTAPMSVESLMNRTFIGTNGKRFTVCDYKPSNTKYPVIAKNDNGTRYKFPLSVVTKGLI